MYWQFSSNCSFIYLLENTNKKSNDLYFETVSKKACSTTSNLPYLLNLHKECNSFIKKNQTIEMLHIFFPKCVSKVGFSFFFDFFGVQSAGFISSIETRKKQHCFVNYRVEEIKNIAFGSSYAKLHSLSVNQRWSLLNFAVNKHISQQWFFFSSGVFASFMDFSPAKKNKIAYVENKMWLSTRVVGVKNFERGAHNSMFFTRQQYNFFENFSGRWLSCFFGYAPFFVSMHQFTIFIRYELEIVTNCIGVFFSDKLLNNVLLLLHEFFIKKLQYCWNMFTYEQRIFWFYIFFLHFSLAKFFYYQSMFFSRNLTELQNFNRQQWWNSYFPVYQTIPFYLYSFFKQPILFVSQTGLFFFSYTSLKTTLVSGFLSL